MPTQNLLRLLLLLMLATRIVLATICGRFGSWGLVIKLNFCSDFEHKVWSRFRSWSKGEIWSWSLVSFFCWCFVEVIWILVEILKLGLANIFKFNFSRDIWDFEVDTCPRFWSMKFDQDLCATCDMNSTLGSVVPLAMFFFQSPFFENVFQVFRYALECRFSFNWVTLVTSWVCLILWESSLLTVIKGRGLTFTIRKSLFTTDDSLHDKMLWRHDPHCLKGQN